MEPLETMTAEQYGSFLVEAIEECDSPEIKQQLTESYEHLVLELTHLERCFSIDPYESLRRI